MYRYLKKDLDFMMDGNNAISSEFIEHWYTSEFNQFIPLKNVYSIRRSDCVKS